MRRLTLVCLIMVLVCGCQQPPGDVTVLADEYIDAWASFYPSRALTAGSAEAAFAFEDLSPARVDNWIELNRRTLERIVSAAPAESLEIEIDRRHLERRIRSEIFRWNEFEAHLRNPLFYSSLINHSLTPVLVRQNLSPDQKFDAVLTRLQGLELLSSRARNNLVDGRPAAIASAARSIASTAEWIQDGLAGALQLEAESERYDAFLERSAATGRALAELAEWLDYRLSFQSSLEDAYGEAHYARELALAYGAELTPDRLEAIAELEIETVRKVIAELAQDYWEETQSGPAPEDFNLLVDPALEAMEANRAASQQEFLEVFIDLVDRSEEFLRNHDIADVPQQRTLFTDLSPAHFAGAAVGGVYSAGPFDPEAETLFYLPSVPDTASEQVKEGFYRSFNNHFNSMIITHEIYPGHYHQLKAAAYHRSRVRPLFTGNDFTEGWASFCEQMMLDAGWEDDLLLTRMAHLRKRLENAVRAYVSVQVHCRGWGQNRLRAFAVETGLLPPQFAENLWGRALHSPIQLPSYFVGFRAFNAALEKERNRLGDDFNLRDFNNSVLQSGGLPMDMLEEYLVASSG